MKIAVTTASGNLGQAIVEQLKKAIGAENVIGIARTLSKAEHLGVEIRKGDYASADDFNKALEGVDTILIVSGNDAPEKRIDQHHNIINAAKSNKLRKIVYTSIIGDPEKTAFSPVIASNRQTEEDVKASGLDWVIGRNSLYIEPDLEYIDKYIEAGEVSNCAGDGLCAYTNRSELAYAYAKMLLENKHNGNTYNLAGEPVSQQELADAINTYFKTNLNYRPVSVDAYLTERKNALGEFLGTIIAGIYEGIRNGSFNPVSDYKKATGRPHKSLNEMIEDFKKSL